MDRALPGPMIDLITDGVAPAALKINGGKAVYAALVTTAASAYLRGWDRTEWEALVQEPRRTLGRQVALKDGHRQRSPKAINKALRDAWDAATVWLSKQGPAWDRDQMREASEARARALIDMTDDPDADLTGAERDVLRVVADMAITKGIERLALPRRVLQEHTGLGLTALRSTLKRLDQTGLLVLAEAGRAGGPSARKRRANLYRIAGADTPALAPYLYRGTRSVVPPTQICGAPPADAHGAQHQICGAPQEPTRPTPETDTEQETNVITLTLSSKDPQDLADAIAALGRTGQVQVTKQEPSLPENVVPIRGTGTEGPRP